MRIRRVVIVVILSVTAFCIAVYVGAQSAIGGMQDRIVDATDAPVAQAIIVLGASVLPSGKPSDVLADRLLTAVELYNAEIAPKILVSGDHGTVEYDEVNTMRVFLLDAGVRPEDIFLDHAGFDTYDTMYRAYNVFGIRHAVVATQTFHLPRALYIGTALGMEVYGVAAERQQYLNDDLFAMRERFANVKAYVDIFRNAAPTYTGDVVDIFGDGRVTWDTQDAGDED